MNDWCLVSSRQRVHSLFHQIPEYCFSWSESPLSVFLANSRRDVNCLLLRRDVRLATHLDLGHIQTQTGSQHFVKVSELNDMFPGNGVRLCEMEFKRKGEATVCLFFFFFFVWETAQDGYGR